MLAPSLILSFSRCWLVWCDNIGCCGGCFGGAQWWFFSVGCPGPFLSLSLSLSLHFPKKINKPVGAFSLAFLLAVSFGGSLLWVGLVCTGALPHICKGRTSLRKPGHKKGPYVQ